MAVVGQWEEASSRLLSSANSEQNQEVGMEIGKYTCHSPHEKHSSLETTERRINQRT